MGSTIGRYRVGIRAVQVYEGVERAGWLGSGESS